jgi:hypothetical protein
MSELEKYTGYSDLTHLDVKSKDKKDRVAGRQGGDGGRSGQGTHAAREKGGGVWAAILGSGSRTLGLKSRKQRTESLKLIESSPTALRMRGEFLRFT